MITKEQALKLKVSDIVHGSLKGPKGCEEWTVLSPNTFSAERWRVQLKQGYSTYAAICSGREWEWHLPEDCLKTITVSIQAKPAEIADFVAEARKALPGWTLNISP